MIMRGPMRHLNSVSLSAISEKHPAARFIAMLGVASVVSTAFFFVGVWHNHSLLYEYLLWNLFLAWLPLVFAAILVRLLPHRAWLSAWPITLSVLWLSFLPNSFYMVSDYIHLQEIQRADILFDVVMFTSFIFVGLAVGFTSLLLVHRELARRFSPKVTTRSVAFILLLCSYAIFLGRNLRWNTWDVILNPAGLLFDVSDRFIHPGSHPQMFLTTAAFFVLLSTLYAVVWQAVHLLRPAKS